jgi:hypothetical protein
MFIFFEKDYLQKILKSFRVRDYYYFKFQNSNTSVDSSEYFPKYK